MEFLEKYFADLSALQKNQFKLLEPLYREWNDKINVISRKDMENFYLHHVLHSLSLAAPFRFTPGMNVMDLGAGGGFPGLPLAIYFPETEFVLVDSIQKKLRVAKEIAAEIGLKNIQVLHTRVEEIKGRKFDVITSRAVAPLKDLWKWSRPQLKKNNNSGFDQPNGLVCLKGGDLSTEIQESGCKPYIWEINKIFNEVYFNEKFILYQPAVI